MSVSVVIPVYNAFEFVRGCIESIFAARTAIPFEVIVVDNGSAAEVGVWLQEAARRWPGLRILHFDDPLGFARAVNEGMREARGEHLHHVVALDARARPGLEQVPQAAVLREDLLRAECHGAL